jgi:excisionase family DNA binding protein
MVFCVIKKHDVPKQAFWLVKHMLSFSFILFVLFVLTAKLCYKCKLIKEYSAPKIMATLRPGEIARYCDVHQRTVSRWIAQGRLKGYKLPGRGNYRVLIPDFVLFLKHQDMPIPDDFATYDETTAIVGTSVKRILIIDDEAEIRNAIRRVLRPSGFDIISAADGFQAGVKLLSEKPDLITLDLSMPKLDGYEVLQFIQQQPSMRHIKIVVISGLSKNDLDKALGLGADLALPKPFDNERLRHAVTQLLD